jgi:uncharacterized iron-regulated protein
MAATVQAGVQPISQELTIAIDTATGKLTGTAEITVPAPDGVHFDLSGLTVLSQRIDGASADAALLKENILSLDGSNRERKITIDYELTCTPEKYGSCLISQDAAVLIGNWHPVPDRDAIFKLTAHIPDSFEAVSEADTIQVSQDISGKKIEFYFPHPTRSIHFIAGPYTLEEESFGSDQILASYFFPEDIALAESYRQKAKEYLERYIELIGPYPYKRFAIVENRLPTGYAMPTFTLLGQSVVRLPFIVNTSLGHEVLHSWFGNAIRVDRGSGNWCEGLATYLADQSFAADNGEGTIFRKGQFIKYQSYVTPDNAFPLKQFIGADLATGKDNQAARAIGYGKSSMIFHMLRNKLGPDVFNQALRDFYCRMNGKIASWKDIQISFENAASRNLDSFFSQWLTRADIPVIDVQKLSLRENDGQLILSFTIHQGTETPYEFDISLQIDVSGGQIDKTISIAEKETPVEIPLANYPSLMVLDPDYDLLRDLTSSEFPPVWDRFAGSQNSLAVISSADTSDLFAPLIEILKAGGTKIVAAEEVTDSELAQNSVIFLGTEGALSRGLFAQVEHAEKGFTIDIRKNPLNHNQVVVLASVDSVDEAAKAAVKLKRYGKYSFLYFQNGRVISKEIAHSENGQQYSLNVQPLGVEARKAMDFTEIIDNIADKKVVYVGELHQQYQDHKLQLMVIRELFNRDPKLAIGMEMFPRSAQDALDRYIHDEIDEKEFLKKSGYFNVWGFDYRLYREILHYARQNKIRVVGLNIEKEKVSKVSRDGGFSSLNREEKASIPLDRDLAMPYYRERLSAVFSMHPNRGDTRPFANFLQAQAIWDETMAESIVNYLTEHPADKMVVLAGNGHVIKENAIPPRVKRRMEVDQSIIVNADGGAIYPPEIDYLVFSPPAELPPRVLIGIVMKEDKEKGQVIIDDLASQGLAEKAGIKKGDILLSLDDEPIATIDDVKIVMVFKKRGDKMKIVAKRPHAFFPDEKFSFEVQL